MKLKHKDALYWINLILQSKNIKLSKDLKIIIQDETVKVFSIKKS